MIYDISSSRVASIGLKRGSVTSIFCTSCHVHLCSFVMEAVCKQPPCEIKSIDCLFHRIEFRLVPELIYTIELDFRLIDPTLHLMWFNRQYNANTEASTGSSNNFVLSDLFSKTLTYDVLYTDYVCTVFMKIQ